MVTSQEERIIMPILLELDKAEEQHPTWPSDIVHAAAIVNEESGELIRAALNHHYFGESKEEIRKEAIQTAATCIRLLKNL
jgi:hypothetical protein